MRRPAVVPEGALVEVTLTIRMPGAATPEQLDEWLEFTVGNFGTLSLDNPLREHEPESWGLSRPHWTDTGLRGRAVDSPRVRHADGSVRYTTRYTAEPRS